MNCQTTSVQVGVNERLYGIWGRKCPSGSRAPTTVHCTSGTWNIHTATPRSRAYSGTSQRRHTEPQDSDDWLKRTNAHTQLSKACAENQRHIFLYACGDQKWNARSDKRSTSFQKIYVCLARRAGAKQPKQIPKTSPKTQYGSVLI